MKVVQVEQGNPFLCFYHYTSDKAGNLSQLPLFCVSCCSLRWRVTNKPLIREEIMSESATAAEIGKVFRVVRTVGEMCRDRGYEVPAEFLVSSLDDFRNRFTKDNDSGQRVILRERLTLRVHHHLDGTPMYVFFCGDESVNAQRVADYRKRASSDRVHRVILVTKGKINVIARRLMETVEKGEDAVHIQSFDEDDLVVNITQHELVPKHTPLTEEQTKEVLTAFSLQASMLPRMLSQDPVALYFGLSKGNVVRITRKSETAGEYVTYRQVV